MLIIGECAEGVCVWRRKVMAPLGDNGNTIS